MDNRIQSPNDFLQGQRDWRELQDLTLSRMRFYLRKVSFIDTLWK